MKKTLLLVAVLAAVSFNSFSQSARQGKFNIGFDAGLPIAETGDVYSTVFGGSVRYDHPLTDNVFFNITAGYSALFYKSEFKGFANKSSEGLIPLKVGARYFLSKTLFGETQIGAAFATADGGGTFLAHNTGLGLAFDSGVDLSIRYEAWTQSSISLQQIALRLGYSF